MRWITFFILLYLMAALQESHLGAIPHPQGDAWPAIEYLPILAIFYALYAAESAAPLAGLLCGLLYDFANSDFLGINAVPLALVALLIVRVRLSIFREHFMSQLLITLFSIVAFGVFSMVARLIANSPLQGHSVWAHVATFAGDAVYSSLIAPFIFWALFRAPGLLGFTTHGPRAGRGGGGGGGKW
jgi:rod shape-determining protein MreD